MTKAPQAISVGHPASARIAKDVLDAGGNAVDAGVAACIALTVVHSEQVQLGGVAPMIVFNAADKQTYAIEGAGRWPKVADPAIFQSSHRGRIPSGILRTVVPAAVCAWTSALARFGTMGLADLIAPAIPLARDGFPASSDATKITTRFQRHFARNPENGKIWLPDGRPVKSGQIFVQADLANTLERLMAADLKGARGEGRLAGLAAARKLFYAGDIADQMVQHVSELGGWLSAEDLAVHTSPIVPATQARLFGGTLFTCGPWTQGPALSQTLKVIEKIAISRSITHHEILEALKLSLADREAHYGDADFVEVPLSQLLSDSYAEQRAQLVALDRSFPGLPPAGCASQESNASRTKVGMGSATGEALDTSVAAIADRFGNVFAATPSDKSFDAPAVPGLGFVISTRGSQSYVDQSHPASMAPGKRPRVSACPMLFLGSNGRFLAGGGPGGDLQLQAMAQVLALHLANGVSLSEAIAEPRVFTLSAPTSDEPHFAKAGGVAVEENVSSDTLLDLARRGHNISPDPVTGLISPSVCIVSGRLGEPTSEAFGDHRRASGQFSNAT